MPKAIACIPHVQRMDAHKLEYLRAINYAIKKNIDFELIEPRKRKTVKKSYADNFLK